MVEVVIQVVIIKAIIPNITLLARRPRLANSVFLLLEEVCAGTLYLRFPLNPCNLLVRRNPHPGIVTIRDNTDFIRVLLCSYHTNTAGWGSS